ncbi:MAG: arsenosugar biosynthesis radical SAM protein ArsS [Chromatiales bacterium]|jgi:radical SAM/Cys-rich protein
MLDSKALLFPSDFPPLQRRSVSTLQVNMGMRCNQSCVHCHVNAGPQRSEMMSRQTADQVVEFLQREPVATLDITGGAPELNDNFRYLVTAAAEQGLQVMDRCNLTVLQEPDQQDLAEFLAEHRVEVIASLPCYLQENVDQQRGKGVFDASMHALRKLNELGYGQQDSGLQLNLVYNPVGAYLPPGQQQLEDDYRKQLHERFGIRFNHLFTITNMPISRFGSYLQSKGEFETYMDLLKNAFQPDNLDTVMCRDLLSIDWQGYVYDCDFNQMLNMPLHRSNGGRLHISQVNTDRLEQHDILVAEHCYGCTAGQGSSCGGALSD